MNDYTARDIHRLDQAYPDAVADIDDFIGNPANRRRLAEVGPEVFAAELTRDLAYTTDNPMSLAGWAAVATTRLMEAEKVWQDDTEMAWAKVDELTAELAKTRDALTDANRQRTVAEATTEALKRDNAGYATQVADLKRAKKDLATERDGLKAGVVQLIKFRNAKVAEVRDLSERLSRLRAAVEQSHKRGAGFMDTSELLDLLGEPLPAESRPAFEAEVAP